MFFYFENSNIHFPAIDFLTQQWALAICRQEYLWNKCVLQHLWHCFCTYRHISDSLDLSSHTSKASDSSIGPVHMRKERMRLNILHTGYSRAKPLHWIILQQLQTEKEREIITVKLFLLGNSLTPQKIVSRKSYSLIETKYFIVTI